MLDVRALTDISNYRTSQPFMPCTAALADPATSPKLGSAETCEAVSNSTLFRRDNSVTTGVSTVSLNPDLVTQVQWWEHPDFETKECWKQRNWLHSMYWNRRCGVVAASPIASKNFIRIQFRDQMKAVFAGEGAGRLQVRTLSQAWQRIDELEKQLREIRSQLDVQD